MDYFTLRDVHVALGGSSILKGISLQVKKGEMISLLGPSGCGKSTLLKTTAGLIEADQGEVWIGDKLMNHVAPENRGAVIVFQDLRLFPHMDVGENIAFGLKMKGIRQEESNTRIRALLEKVGLTGYEKRKVQELSGGQQQRVALARALASRPRLLLLDEPFSSLDDHLRQKMRELVLALHQELDLTTLLVTHDQEEALLMSDRVAVMFNGRIEQYDTPQNLYEHPATPEIADYFGEMNYISGAVQNGYFTGALPDFPDRIPVVLDDGKYRLMLKPHHIRLKREAGPWQVTAVGYQGARSLVRLAAGGQELCLTTEGEDRVRVGESVRVEFDCSKGVFYRQ